MTNDVPDSKVQTFEHHKRGTFTGVVVYEDATWVRIQPVGGSVADRVTLRKSLCTEVVDGE